MKCQYCKNNKVIKYGIRRNKGTSKQIYKCQKCEHKFVKNDGFCHRSYSSDVITVALDLYVKGVSLRDTADHIRMVYGVKPSHTTILEWIKQYGKMIEKYTDNLKPRLGSVWSADEMQIHMKSNKEFAMSYGNWLINVMDKRTRFLVVSEPRLFRDARTMSQIFDNLSEKHAPKVLITDGCHSYKSSIRDSFGNRTKHVIAKGPGNKKNQSSRIERLNGTIRQREKVTRNYWRVSTARNTMRTFRIYYNFVRPNMALSGKTPAQKAGICLNLTGNRWRGLIEKSCMIK